MAIPTKLTKSIPLPTEVSGTYEIIEEQLPLVGGAGGHNFLVLVDPSGSVISELDGLATSSSGAIQPIGLFGSSLYSYDTSGTYFNNSSYSQATLFSGNYSQVSNLWYAAESCGAQINSLNLPYPFAGLGSNSNSVTSTLDACMGLAEPSSVANNATFTPGQGTLLLSPSTISGIQALYAIAPATSTGTPSIESDTNSSGTTTITTANPTGGITTDTIGPSSATETISNTAGAITGQETLSIGTSGAATINVSGTGIGVSTDGGAVNGTANSTGGSITVDPGTSTSVTGYNNFIQGENWQNLQVIGSNNVINSTGGVDLSLLNGSGNTVTVNGSGLTMFASNDLEGVSIGSQAILVGSGNTATVQANASLSLSGGSGNTVTIDGSGATIVDQNTSDVINASTGSDTIAANNSTINVAAGESATINGSGDTIDAAAGSFVTLAGTGDTTIFSGAGTLDLTSGTGDVANGSGDTVNIGTGASVTVNGNSDVADFIGTGSLAIGTGSAGDIVNSYANDTVSGSSATVNVGAENATGNSTGYTDINGSGDLINDNGHAVTISGSDTLNGSGALVSLGANDILTTDSGGNTIYTMANDGISGNGNTVVVGGNQTAGVSTGYTNINGNGDLIDDNGHDLAVAGNDTLNGSGALVWLGSNETLTTDSGGNTIYTMLNDGVTGNGNTVDVGGNQTAGVSTGYTNINGNGDLIDDNGHDLAVAGNDTLNGSGAFVWLGSNETLTTDSGGNTIYTMLNDAIGGNGNNIDVGGNQTAGVSTGYTDINGNGDLINAGNGNNVTVVGNDNLTGTANHIWLGSSTTITDDGKSEVVYTNANDELIGSGMTIDVGGNIAAGQSTGTTLVDGSDVIDATGRTITEVGNSTNDQLAGSDDKVIADGKADVITITGNDDSARAVDAGDTITETGSKDYANISSGTVNVEANSSVLVTGSYDHVTAFAGAGVDVDGFDDPSYGSNSAFILYSGGNYAGDSVDGPVSDGVAAGYWTGVGYYGEYGLAKSKASAKTVGSNVALIAASDSNLSSNEISDAAAQVSALEQSGGFDVGTEHAKWASKTVTWSIEPPEASGSTAINAQEESEIAQAFAQWSKLTGLSFKEVVSSAQADIEVGLGDLDTGTTGVVGFTRTHVVAGSLAQGTLIQLEDPTLDPLVTGSGGASVYGGTQVTFEQDALHEIGHALGFADNSNLDSIMSAFMSASDRSLSTSDAQTAKAAYRGQETATSVSPLFRAMHLGQAMAAFNTFASIAQHSETAWAEPIHTMYAARPHMSRIA